MATAPLRKCMSTVAGTPVIDSPYALVMISLPSTVTRTMTAPEVASLHRLLHGPVDRRRLRRVDGRGCARRRALRGAAREQPHAQRHDGEPPGHA